MLSHRVAVLLLTIAFAGCGRGGDVPEPPTTFARMGLQEVLPVRWIESGDENKQVRDYYENVIAYEGEKQDVAVRAHLVVTHEDSSTAARYELTEMRLKGSEPAKISKSSGGIAIEQVPREGGSLMVYQLGVGHCEPVAEADECSRILCVFACGNVRDRFALRRRSNDSG